MNRLIDMNNSSIDCCYSRHAERLASWWLDLVRYADTVGYHGDQTHTAHHHIVIGSLQHFKRIYDLIDLLRCNSRVISSSPVQMNTLKTFSSPVPITGCCRRLMRVDCRSKNTEQSIRLTESEIFLGCGWSNCWLCSVP